MKCFLITQILLIFHNCAFDIGNSFESEKKTGFAESQGSSAHNKPVTETEQYHAAYDRALSLWPVPYMELAIETSFGNAQIIASGPDKAPPVVLLHGMNASSTMWYPNIGELSKNHKVYAIDNLTEPGKSEMNRKVNYMEEVINWYIEILDKLEIHEFTLIGASKGGWLAVNLALHLQNRVERLILLSPLQTFSRIPPGTKVLSAISYALNPKRHRLDNVLKSMSIDVSRMDTLYVDQFHLGSKIADPALLLKNFTPFTRKELITLKMPVLVLIGDKDIINKKSAVEKANEYIPQAETWIIRDAGHFLSMDQSEVTNDRIVNFLNSKDVTTK